MSASAAASDRLAASAAHPAAGQPALQCAVVPSEKDGVSILLTPADRVRLAAGKHAAFYHADCLAVLRQLPSRSIDVIVTSPPYNLGIRYNEYDDTMSRSEYLEWTNGWIAEAARVLRPDGSLFLNVGAKPTDPWTALDVAQTVRSHLQLQNIIHWIK
jgi:site-specific DNA-methyltransferase (adenine-specific)